MRKSTRAAPPQARSDHRPSVLARAAAAALTAWPALLMRSSDALPEECPEPPSPLRPPPGPAPFAPSAESEGRDEDDEEELEIEGLVPFPSRELLPLGERAGWRCEEEAAAAEEGGQ